MTENAIVSAESAANSAAEIAKCSSVGAVWSDREVFNQMLRAADMLSKSQLIPSQYQGKPQDCFIALEMASRTSLSPLVVLQNLYVVKGKPSWSGQACLTLINASGRFADARPVYSGTVGTDNRACRIVATRLSTGEQTEGPEVSIKMAQAEGWLSNPKWKSMPELMLAYRAAAFFARTQCPESLMGMKIEGEWEDIEANKQHGSMSSLTAKLDAAIVGTERNLENDK